MAELKTKQTGASVAEFLAAIPDAERRADCGTIAKLMRDATGAAPKMWGSAIAGFGEYHYEYESGREGDWFIMGFSPRKQSLTLYFMSGLERLAPMLDELGKHKRGKGCLYIGRLADVNTGVLERMIRTAARAVPRTASR